MGNSASQLPYSIDNQVGAPHDHNGWALHNGKSTDGQEVSVFVGKKPQLAKQPCSPRFPNQMQLIPALHHYDYARKLRHPQILKVYATLDTDNPTAASKEGQSPTAGAGASAESNPKTTTGDLIIVTEPCISLNQWILSNPSPQELAWGLECLVRGLHFMHSSAKLVHGNLSPASLYVTRAGDVKLWNFSLVTAIESTGPSPHFREWEGICTPDAYRSPERVDRRWDTIANLSANAVHGMDSYALGVLMDLWFSGKVPAPLQKAVQRMQTPNLKMRPRLQPLLKCPIFDTPFQKWQIQLEELAVQPLEQKVVMWQNLGQAMSVGQTIPKHVALFKVLTLIQGSIKTTCHNESMLNQDLYRREVLAMLQPLFFIVENYLEPSDIGKELGPLVSLLFMVKDRGVRGALLSKVTFMSQHLEKNTLNASVFGPLCSGFNDSSPALRELTLKATLDLVPSLNAPNLEKLSRYLVRLQGDSETSIRTNAVIFIAKLAPSLSEMARDKMLLPAYARAMKDIFAPCRMSALKSTRSSEALFSREALANKVLPCIMPLLLDPMADVRAEAFGVVNHFMNVLKVESDRLATMAQQQQLQQQQPQQQGGQPSAAAPVAGAPTSKNGVAPAPTSGSYLSGLSSWMSSSTKPGAPAAPAPAAPVAPPPYPKPAAPAPVAPVQQQFAATSLAASTPAADDGWDDTDGWGDDDDIPAATTPASNTFTTPASKSPSVFSTPNQFDTPNQFSADVDDPFAAIGMKTTATTTRPSGGKLLMPKKAGLVLKPKAAAPVTKLNMDDEEITDGWDDF